MTLQRHIRCLVIGLLFISLAVCTAVVQQYVFTLLLGSAGYWITLCGIFGTFPEESGTQAGQPGSRARWLLAGLAGFFVIAGLVFWLMPNRGQTHKTAEDIQLTVDRSADAGLHQQFVSELVTPEETKDTADSLQQPIDRTHDYVLNTNTKVFHVPDCSFVNTMSEQNKQSYTGTREDVVDMGYEPCGHCTP